MYMYQTVETTYLDNYNSRFLILLSYFSNLLILKILLNYKELSQKVIPVFTLQRGICPEPKKL